MLFLNISVNRLVVQRIKIVSRAISERRCKQHALATDFTQSDASFCSHENIRTWVHTSFLSYIRLISR